VQSVMTFTRAVKSSRCEEGCRGRTGVGEQKGGEWSKRAAYSLPGGPGKKELGELISVSLRKNEETKNKC